MIFKMDRKIISNFQDLADLFQELEDKNNDKEQQIDELLDLSKVLQTNMNLANNELEQKDICLENIKTLNWAIEDIIKIINSLK